MPIFNQYKMTPKIVKRLIIDIRAGVPQKTACACAGIPEYLYNSYIKKAEALIASDKVDLTRQEKILIDFYEKMKTAESEYESFLYHKEHEHIFDLNNPTVLMNTMKCRLPKTHNPASTQHNVDIPISVSSVDAKDILDKIKKNIGGSDE